MGWKQGYIHSANDTYPRPRGWPFSSPQSKYIQSTTAYLVMSHLRTDRRWTTFCRRLSQVQRRTVIYEAILHRHYLPTHLFN